MRFRRGNKLKRRFRHIAAALVMLFLVFGVLPSATPISGTWPSLAAISDMWCPGALVAQADSIPFDPNDYPGEFDYEYAYEVLEIVNEVRKAGGRPEIKMEKSLLDSAMLRAAEIPNYFSHYRPNGTSFRTTNTIVDQENIAFGFFSPEDVMDCWMNSYAHWDNIMYDGYNTIGIGCYRYGGSVYWVQHFSPTKISESYADPRGLGFSNNIEDYDITRYAGKNRYETALQIANSIGVLFDYQEGRFGDMTIKEFISRYGEMFTEAGDSFDTVIVAYGGNYADALSGSYLAYLTKAPIVLVNKSNENQIIDYVNKKLVDDGQVYILGGPSVVSDHLEETLSGNFFVTRLWGNDRYGTNLSILKECNRLLGKGELSAYNADGAGESTASEVDGASESTGSAEFVYPDGPCLVCSGKGFADALSASAACMPILLVGDKLTGDQEAYLEKTEYDYSIIGGTLAVSNDVEYALSDSGVVRTRLAGKDRFETSVLVAKSFFPSKPETVMLAYSQNFPDGLSGAPLAQMYNAPLILVNNKNYQHAVDYCKSVVAKALGIFGGELVISNDTAIKCLAW